ncbi:hypothetical protein AVEN_152396-1 [Araneus ventricosus]|uniref:Uncharacterized protein n=1 Tax=Araneus ventricosus TaxID=182803 RepID=A0A4Y2DD67_ARAVE|nr:hypothetical protein AVEN_152396-1 [Araneus ventricosus]
MKRKGRNGKTKVDGLKSVRVQGTVELHVKLETPVRNRCVCKEEYIYICHWDLLQMTASAERSGYHRQRIGFFPASVRVQASTVLDIPRICVYAKSLRTSNSPSEKLQRSLFNRLDTKAGRG